MKLQDCLTTTNDNKMPLHGPYTPKSGNASTKGIDAAELFKKIKCSFSKVTCAKYGHLSPPPPRCQYFVHVTFEKYKK